MCLECNVKKKKKIHWIYFALLIRQIELPVFKGTFWPKVRFIH